MGERARELTIVATGVALGAVSAYVLLTPRGRAMLYRLGPAMEEITEALAEIRRLIQRVDAAADEGRQVIHEVDGALQRLERSLAG